MEPGTGNKAPAQIYVKQLSSMGGASALKGLKTAFGIPGVDMIFFLSDGHPSDAGADKILREVQAMNRNGKITVHCIGLGKDKDERFMKEPAAQNNGIYVER